MPDAHGFSLIEMLCVLALVSIIAGLAAPSFRNLRLDAARSREVNQWVHAIHLARAEAIKRDGVVTLCASADAESCTPSPSSWSAGWIVFVNADADSPAARDAGEPLLQVYPGWTTGSIIGNRDFLSFRPFGQTGVTATHVFCDARGAIAARAVIVSQTGRPRVSETRSGGEPLECP